MSRRAFHGPAENEGAEGTSPVPAIYMLSIDGQLHPLSLKRSSFICVYVGVPHCTVESLEAFTLEAGKGSEYTCFR
jgi:hypothetical protein